MKDTFVKVGAYTNEAQGLNLAINFYIIRYMYSHLQCINDAFKEEPPYRKRYDVLDNFFNIGVNRFNYILNLNSSFRYYAKDAANLVNKLNIPESYVVPDGATEKDGNKLIGKVIELKNIKQEEWEYFLYCKFKEGKDDDNERDEEIIKKIETELKNLCKRNYIERIYKKEHVLYAIYHYLTYNEKYDSEKKAAVAMKFMEGLKISDWQEMTDEKLNEYKNVISKQYRMIDAIQCYRENKIE